MDAEIVPRVVPQRQLLWRKNNLLQARENFLQQVETWPDFISG